ncbi:MAG TPA: thioredoxin family protein [Fimbriimonadaceae bacterium]|nr:thioredoxin family protein [Fimbriimonadaceae bacterium]
MKKLSLFIGTSLVAAAAISMAAIAARSSAAVGSAAPAFDTTDSNGKAVKLSAYKGKYVVLEWANFDCPYVKKHYNSHNMQSLQKTYTEKGVAWLTVFSSPEGAQGYYTPDKLNAMAKEKGMSSTLIPDPKGALGQLYGATNTPNMFVIDPEGKLIYAGAIDDNRSSDPGVIKTSHNYVAAALDEAMAGKPVTTPKSRPYGCGIHYSD